MGCSKYFQDVFLFVSQELLITVDSITATASNSKNTETSISSVASLNMYQMSTNIPPQDVPVNEKLFTAGTHLNDKIPSHRIKVENCRGTGNKVSQALETKSSATPTGLASSSVSQVDSNTIVIGDRMEGCVVVDLQGNLVVKENCSVQTHPTPYLINDNLLVQVGNGKNSVPTQATETSDFGSLCVLPKSNSLSLNDNSKDLVGRKCSVEYSSSSDSVHLKSQFVQNEVLRNTSFPQDVPKENLQLKVERDDSCMQLSKRKSARKARLRLKTLHEDDDIISQIKSFKRPTLYAPVNGDGMKKQKIYPFPADDGKIGDTLSSEPLADVPVWARGLMSVRVLDNKLIVGIASSKDILYQTMEGHSRSILCDYIKSHPSNSEKRRNARDQECRVMWQYKWIIFDGVPFSMVSSDDLRCTFGMNYKLKRKNSQKLQESPIKEDSEDQVIDSETAKSDKNHDSEGSKALLEGSITPKKMYKEVARTSCPAKIIVKVIIKYPGYRVSPCALRAERKMMLKALRSDLSQNVSVEKEELYYVTLPMESMHNHSFTGRSRNIHSSIIEKVKALVQDGITTPKVIKNLLDTHVQMEHGKDVVVPHPEDRAYYPKLKDIGNLVYNYCKRMGIPSRQKNSAGQALELNSRRKRLKRTHSEFDNEGDCGENMVTDNIPLQASTLQEAVQTFCTDETDRGTLSVSEQECLPNATLTQNPVSEVTSLAESVRLQLDALRNLTYSITEIGPIQEMYQSLQVVLNQFSSVSSQNLQAMDGSGGATAAAAFIIHESVIDPLQAGDAPVQTAAIPASYPNAVGERDTTGTALAGKLRSLQVVENQHIRQFRSPIALQCLTTNVVPTLTMSQVPRSTGQTAVQGATHLVTSIPSHNAGSAPTVSVAQPTYQTLAPAQHDPAAVPVQLSLPPYFYYVQEVTVPDMSSNSCSTDAH